MPRFLLPRKPEGATFSPRRRRKSVVRYAQRNENFVLVVRFARAWRDIKGEALGFYEAEFVKTRRENCFLFIFGSFWPTSGNNSPGWLWYLIAAVRGNERHSDQTPKSVILSSAQRSWFKASAVSLNQWSGALPKL